MPVWWRQFFMYWTSSSKSAHSVVCRSCIVVHKISWMSRLQRSTDPCDCEWRGLPWTNSHPCHCSMSAFKVEFSNSRPLSVCKIFGAPEIVVVLFNWLREPTKSRKDRLDVSSNFCSSFGFKSAQNDKLCQMILVDENELESAVRLGLEIDEIKLKFKLIKNHNSLYLPDNVRFVEYSISAWQRLLSWPFLSSIGSSGNSRRKPGWSLYKLAINDYFPKMLT